MKRKSLKLSEKTYAKGGKHGESDRIFIRLRNFQYQGRFLLFVNTVFSDCPTKKLGMFSGK